MWDKFLQMNSKTGERTRGEARYTLKRLTIAFTNLAKSQIYPAMADRFLWIPVSATSEKIDTLARCVQRQKIVDHDEAMQTERDHVLERTRLISAIQCIVSKFINIGLFEEPDCRDAIDRCSQV